MALVTGRPGAEATMMLCHDLPALHPQLQLRVNCCSGDVWGPLGLRDPRQPHGTAGLEPSPGGTGTLLCMHLCGRVSPRVCICVSGCAHSCSQTQGLTQALPAG